MARPSLVSNAPAQRSTRVVPSSSAAGRRTRTAGLLAGIAAALTVVVLPATAQAAPSTPDAKATQATTPEQATQLASKADQQLEAVSEQVNDAQAQLVDRQRAVVESDKAVADARARVAALDGQMRQVARSAFTGENMSRFNALMTSGSADAFLDQVSTLDALAGHANDVLAQVTAAERAAEQAKVDAQTAAADAARSLDAVRDQQADLKEQIADYRAQFDALSAAQKQAVVVETAGVELAPPVKVAAPTASAQKAVDAALAHVGDPYVWGAAGPNAFDCSGLTQYAYAAAGVSLPHSSKGQSTMGTAVARADLQPGDLVFFYSPVSHVGMYIGNGQMVHASTFGKPVIVTSVDMAGYVGARRFVG